MRKFITAVFCTALAFSGGLTAYADEMLDRDYIEAEIWEEMWHGKGDNGLDFPEASYKHHLLDKWLNDNYGSDEYDWTALGELKYEYRDYYRSLIEDWDFEDDDNGNWTIDTENDHYSFYLLNGVWQMIDQNGDTVDTFPLFSTLEEDENNRADGYAIHDDGADSPRVIGNVTGRTETASEGLTDGEGSDTAESLASGSEGDTEHSGVNQLALVAGVAAVAGIGGTGYYIMKKRK